MTSTPISLPSTTIKSRSSTEERGVEERPKEVVLRSFLFLGKKETLVEKKFRKMFTNKVLHAKRNKIDIKTDSDPHSAGIGSQSLPSSITGVKKRQIGTSSFSPTMSKVLTPQQEKRVIEGETRPIPESPSRESMSSENLT